jgi:hypothetical protein
VAVTQSVRDDGSVAFTLASTRIRGTIVFVPDVRDHEAVPDRLVVRFGDGGHPLASALRDLPVIDTVTWVGGAEGIDLDKQGWTRQLLLAHDRIDLSSRRAASAKGHARLVCARLGRAYQRLDRDALMLAAARHTAPRRLARWVHQQILPGYRTLAADQHALARAWTVAEQLQQLSPLPVLPHRPDRTASAVGGPSTYISGGRGGLWLTCPRCHQPTAPLRAGAVLADLLAADRQHTCSSAHR